MCRSPEGRLAPARTGTAGRCERTFPRLGWQTLKRSRSTCTATHVSRSRSPDPERSERGRSSGVEESPHLPADHRLLATDYRLSSFIFLL